MTQIVVSDLTRFNNREIVCIAGLDRKTGKCIRPLRDERPHYLEYRYVKENGIQPGSVLEGIFTVKREPAPHIEDHRVRNLRVLEHVDSEEFESLLRRSAVHSVKDGFGRVPSNRVFSTAMSPPPVSLLTLLLEDPCNQIQIVEDGYDKTKIKAHITDKSGEVFSWVPITDLGFYDHVSVLKKADPGLMELNAFIHEQDFVLLRLGLSRAYRQSEERNGFWLQANGIYTFPNYREDLRRYD